MNVALSWTIGIPTYNRAAFLREALNSIALQVVKPGCIIVTDNCSTDDTKSVVFHDSSLQIEYIRHDSPISPLTNFRSSLLRCHTEYFSWLQDDDYIFPMLGSDLLQVMDENPNVVAAIGYAYCSKDISRMRFLDVKVWGPPPFEMSFETGSALLVPKHCLIPWLYFFWPGFSPVAIFRTQALLEAFNTLPLLEGYSSLLFERYLIASLNSIGDIAYIPSILGVLRQHKANSSAAFASYTAREVSSSMLRLASHIYSLLPRDLAAVEHFFASMIQNFDSDEINQIIKSLSRCANHKFYNLISSWLCQYCQHAACESARSMMMRVNYDQYLSSLSLLISCIVPPFIYSFLARASRHACSIASYLLGTIKRTQ